MNPVTPASEACDVSRSSSSDDTRNTIRDCFDRIVSVLTSRPAAGRHVRQSVTRIDSGMTCETHEGAFCIKSDMPTLAGGRGEHPTPGMLGRASLGSCLCIGYWLRAAHRGIAIRSLEVELQADDDENGLFGTTAVSPGYAELRYIVRIDTDLDEAALEEFLDECDSYSPLLDNYSRALRCVRRIERVEATALA